ncbi:MAG: guanylate kinase, partial [Anaerolineae bacterium]
MHRLLDPYQPIPNPLLVIISGPSGVGKDTVLRRMKERGYPFHFVITTTDRAPRPGEVHGRDYFFVSTREFERMIEAGELLEHAVVYGQYKGISRAQVREALDSGQDVIMRIDVQGAATIRRLAPEAVFIFLTCESEEALVSRLKARGTETETTLQARLAVISQEFQH